MRRTPFLLALLVLLLLVPLCCRAADSAPPRTPAPPPQQWVWANPGGIWQWIAAALYHTNEGPHKVRP